MWHVLCRLKAFERLVTTPLLMLHPNKTAQKLILAFILDWLEIFRNFKITKGSDPLDPTMYSAGADRKPIVRFWWNLVCNIGLAIGWCTASFVDLGQLLISDFHGVPPLDFLLKFMNDPVKIQLKIQRGDPMKIWNWKLSQIYETCCASTCG